MKNMAMRVCFFILLSVFCLSCAERSERRRMALPADTARVSAAEVPAADSIRLYAELVCDSASYLVMENRGSRPVTTDAGYRFEQRVHGRWKSVPVRGRDTGRIVLGAGERDTLRLNFRREIGYDPIGFCRIGKTFADVSGTRARFDRMCEAETRSRIIDWKRVDLIPDTIRPDGRFVEMTAEVEGASVLVTVRNRTGREIVFGDESDFRLGVFRDGRWHLLCPGRYGGGLSSETFRYDRTDAARAAVPALPFRAGTLPDCERVLFRTGFQTEIRGLCRVHARSLDRLRRDRRTGDHHRVQIRASGCGVDSCGNTETVDHHLRAWPAYRCRTAIEGAGDLLCRSMTTGRCDFLCYGNGLRFPAERNFSFPSVPLVVPARLAIGSGSKDAIVLSGNLCAGFCRSPYGRAARLTVRCCLDYPGAGWLRFFF